VIEPVYIEDGVRVERSVIGPNVSLETGSVVLDSTISNSVIGRDAKIFHARLEGAFLGNSVLVEQFEGSASLGDHSELSGR
jgi:glucose-1-phosphate thymidylyltransferase